MGSTNSSLITASNIHTLNQPNQNVVKPKIFLPIVTSLPLLTKPPIQDYPTKHSIKKSDSMLTRKELDKEKTVFFTTTNVNYSFKNKTNNYYLNNKDSNNKNNIKKSDVVVVNQGNYL